MEDLPASPGREPTGWHASRPADVAVIQHSSGSTGLQKGVALTHDMILRQCASYARAIALDPAVDRVASWIPLYHDMGLFTTWLMPVLHGVPVAAVDPFAWVQAPASFLRLVHDARGSLAWQPNFAYNLLATRVRDEEMRGIDLSCLRGLSNCSEPVRAASHRVFAERFRAHGLREDALWTCYAMAENSFAVTAAGATTAPVIVRRCAATAFAEGRIEPAADGPATEVVSVGRPIESCEVKVVDGARARLPDDRIGEIAVRSPFTLEAYHRNPEATAAAKDADGWYYTGDLGFETAGQLHVTGRRKDLLIVGGRNFYPQDIEAVVDACAHAVPGRSVAIGVDDEATGTQRVVVLVESRSAHEEERAALAADVRRRVFEEIDCSLSEVHVVPHGWLLKTTSGKIARAPNLSRFREKVAAKPAAPVPSPPRPGGWPAALLWGTLVALSIYAMVALQDNLSWGIYAGF